MKQIQQYHTPQAPQTTDLVSLRTVDVDVLYLRKSERAMVRNTKYFFLSGIEMLHLKYGDIDSENAKTKFKLGY